MTTPQQSFTPEQIAAAMRAHLTAEGGDVWLDGVTYSSQEIIAALDAGTGAVRAAFLRYLDLYAQQDPAAFTELIADGLRRAEP